MQPIKRSTLRRLGLSLAVATAISAQLAGLAPHSAYAEGNGNKPVITKPIPGLGEKLNEKKNDNGPVAKPTIPGLGDVISDKKPDKPTLPGGGPILDPSMLKLPDLRIDGLSVQMGAGNGQCDPPPLPDFLGHLTGA